jgi:hypothetical protein
MRTSLDKLVFIDETGASTEMTRLYGRASRGRRLVAAAPFGHRKTTTFVAGFRGYLFNRVLKRGDNVIGAHLPQRIAVFRVLLVQCPEGIVKLLRRGDDRLVG